MLVMRRVDHAGHGAGRPCWVVGLPTMLGSGPPYYAGYTTTLYHPGYTNLSSYIPGLLVTAHGETERCVTRPWAQLGRNPWVRSLCASSGLLSCYRWWESMRRVAPSLPEQRMKDWIDLGTTPH